MGVYSTDERIDSVNVGSKEMVVTTQDNHILALGKKYWAVDLGKLNWNYNNTGKVFYAEPGGMKATYNSISIYCQGYTYKGFAILAQMAENMACWNNLSNIWIKNNNYSTVEEFKNAVSGLWLVYEFDTSKYDKVDLGSLEWDISTNYRYNSNSLITLAKKTSDNLTKGNIYCLSLATLSANDLNLHTLENAISIDPNGYLKIFRNVEYFEEKTIEQFSNSVKGKTLLYEKATPVLLAINTPEVTE